MAIDDSHHYHDFEVRKANPGRGWVMVQTKELSTETIIDALALGHFYSSTGISLRELDSSPSLIQLKIEQEWDYVYTTTFSGKGGAVLAVVVGPEASYKPRGDEGYVRATIAASSRFRAWTQPVFLGGSGGQQTSSLAHVHGIGQPSPVSTTRQRVSPQTREYAGRPDCQAQAGGQSNTDYGKG